MLDDYSAKDSDLETVVHTLSWIPIPLYLIVRPMLAFSSSSFHSPTGPSRWSVRGYRLERLHPAPLLVMNTFKRCSTIMEGFWLMNRNELATERALSYTKTQIQIHKG